MILIFINLRRNKKKNLAQTFLVIKQCDYEL
jgi:hypothetical protein